MTLEISFLFSHFYRVPKKQSLQSVVVWELFVPDYTNDSIFLKRIILVRHFLCRAKHHIVLSGDAFLRSIGAQALRGGLAKNYF